MIHNINSQKQRWKVCVRVDNEIVPYEALEKQREFHKSAAKYRLYSGAFRAGKTLAGCIEAVKQSTKYSHNRGVIMRATYPELRDTTRKTLLNDIYIMHADGHITTLQNSKLIKKYNKTENTLTFINDSEILFINADKADRLKSLSLGWFYLDEATEIDYEIFKMLKGRLSLRYAGFRGGWLTTNPDTTYHWIYRLFFEGEGVEHTRKSNYATIITNTLENIYLPDDYIEDVKTYDKQYYDRFILGHWNVFEGVIYDMFNKQHLIDYVDLSMIRQWFFVIDFGYTNPAAILLIGIDNNDNVYVVDEFYKTKTGLIDWIDTIESWKETYNIKTLRGYADPSGKGFIQQLINEGYTVQPAYNDVLAGIDKVKSFFRTNKLFINKANVIHLINELKTYRWAKLGGRIIKEQPVKKNDHAVDALRYFIYTYFTDLHKADATEGEVVLID